MSTPRRARTFRDDVALAVLPSVLTQRHASMPHAVAHAFDIADEFMIQRAMGDFVPSELRAGVDRSLSTAAQRVWQLAQSRRRSA